MVLGRGNKVQIIDLIFLFTKTKIVGKFLLKY